MNINLPKSYNVVVSGMGSAIYFISGNKKSSTKNSEFLGFAWPFRLIIKPKRLFWVLCLHYFINILFYCSIFEI